MADSLLQRRQWFLLMALMVAALLVSLTTIVMVFRLPKIETDLLQRTRQSLSAANLPMDNMIFFQGRDAILSGLVSSEEQAKLMATVVQKVWGVRMVQTDLSVDKANSDKEKAATMGAMAGMAGEVSLIGGKMQNKLFVPQKDHPLEQVDLSAIHFEYAKSELNPEAETPLEQVRQLLLKNPKAVIEVSAHTDAIGTALGQMAVTQARAESVKDWLVAHDIKPQRVIATGYGATRPLASNSTEEGRKTNRRIQITVLKE